MKLFEIILIGVALAMDACAIAMTNGMMEKKMSVKKTLCIGGFFGFFQFLMPLLGFFITGIVANAFMATFEKISAWVSFILLALLGGKMLLESIREMHAPNEESEKKEECGELTLWQLTLQAIATSIDALAVGVTLQLAAVQGTLFGGVWFATLCIGGITFLLSVGAVQVGKAIGNKLADKAGLLGGLVLIGIGIKLLLEGIL